MLTNDNFFKGVDRHRRAVEVHADSVNLAVMPMFHIAGAGWSMVGLYHGCQTVLMRDVDPARDPAGDPGVRRHQRVHRAGRDPVPAHDAGRRVDRLLDASAAIVYGASPITDKVLVQGDGDVRLRVHPGVRADRDDRRHHPARRRRPRPGRAGPHLLRSCGKPYPWVEVRIVDAETGEDAPVGEVGELWTRSHQNMKGYWNNPEATADAVTPDGWFRTGDAGYCDADGYLYLHDRVKDMIVSGGENVYPAEVENALMKHPAVADVAVIGVPDERVGRGGEGHRRRRRAAPTCPRPSSSRSPASTSPATSSRSRSTSPTTLPRNPSGKLLKRELRAPYWAGAERHIG